MSRLAGNGTSSNVVVHGIVRALETGACALRRRHVGEPGAARERGVDLLSQSLALGAEDLVANVEVVDAVTVLLVIDAPLGLVELREFVSLEVWVCEGEVLELVAVQRVAKRQGAGRGGDLYSGLYGDGRQHGRHGPVPKGEAERLGCGFVCRCRGARVLSGNPFCVTLEGLLMWC